MQQAIDLSHVALSGMLSLDGMGNAACSSAKLISQTSFDGRLQVARIAAFFF